MLTDSYWTFERLHVEQGELERDMHDCGVSRFKRAQQRAIDSGEASSTSFNTRLTRELILPMSQGIQAYLDYYENRPGKSTQAVAKLRLADPLVSSFIAIKVLFEAVHSEETLQAVCIKLGSRFEDQVRFAKLEHTAPHYVARIQESFKQARSKSYRHQRNVLAESEHKLSETDREGYVNDIHRWTAWPKKDLLGVGLLLVEIAQQSLSYGDAPVFIKVQDTKRSPYRLALSETVQRWIGEYMDFMSQLHPDYTPCVVPPRDWTHPKRGGYYTREVSRTLPMVKVNRRKHLDRLTQQQMPEVYAALNSLQAVPWKINQAVLAVAERILERGLDLGMPQREPYETLPAPVPTEFSELRGPALKAALSEGQFAAFKQWKVDSMQVYRKERTRAAKVDEVCRVVSHAKRFAIYPAIYFVYTLDSRGRVYCRSSLVGPQGGDMQKAMVHFGNPMPLGERGRYWLAVHGAGVWGNDKVSFDERVQFIEEEMRETIKDIAADPCTFRDWTKADKPWQFLAWCLEWADMLDHVSSGEPADSFESRIPVAMDGSCSGIQHYSAMLRDKRGGAAVNLTPGDKPMDIYGEVAAVVRAKLASIAAGELELEVLSQKKVVEGAKLRRMAKAWLDFGVDRKLCKKPVMTLPYGSTLITCREAIEDHVADIQAAEESRARAAGTAPLPVHPFGDIASEMPLLDALALCTKVVWDSIGEVVVAARNGMAMIQAVAKQCAAENKPLAWTTPTGFIVEQAIYKDEAHRIRTSLFGGMRLQLNRATEEMDPHKMQSSAAPNFVHSMDASHLIRSVNAFVDCGVQDIAVIHDSFGTHAGNTDVLREELRREFVNLYLEDQLGAFKNEVQQTLTEELKLEVPMVGTLDLLDLLESEYAFA